MKLKGWNELRFIISIIIFTISMSGCTYKYQSIETETTSTKQPTIPQKMTEEETINIPEDVMNLEEADNSEEGQELIIGCDPFQEEWNPFTVSEESNQQVIRQTQVYLLTQERAGKIVTRARKGQIIPFQGTDYTYTGLSDVEIDVDTQLDQTTYKITIRDDVTFSDGRNLTVDDVIFSLYVFSDPAYNGIYDLKESSIVGLKNYVANNSLADSITDTMVEEKIKNPSKELKKKINEEAILPLLHEELEFCRSMLGKDAYKEFTKDDTKAIEVFARIYSIDSEYQLEGSESEEQVIEAIAKQYDSNYKYLGKVYGDESYFDQQVLNWAREEILQELEEAGESVIYIEGIVKKSVDLVEITTQGYDPTFLSKLMIPVCPLHYYGDETLYDYENHLYGFTKGNLSQIEKNTLPMGAGPYQVVSIEETIVQMRANDSYYLGSPVIKKLWFQEVAEGEKIIDVGEQTIDLVDIVGSKERFDEIREYNSLNTLSGDRIITQRIEASGYGYIGINASTVSVGEDVGSLQSKSLRKALATLLSVYRDAAIQSYYEDAADIIQLPESSCSWAVGFQTETEKDLICYETDMNGESIYSREMTQEDRYRVARNTAKEYLTAAGYTYDDQSGKFIKAPEGAKLEFHVYLNGQGIGDHPSYGILNAAKVAFESIGITLTIHDTKKGRVLWDAIDQGKADLWCAAWRTVAEPSFYQKYHSSFGEVLQGVSYNHSNIQDQQLDVLLESAQNSPDYAKRSESYKEAVSIIMDWAIEVPVYQRYNASLMNSTKIKSEFIPRDVTTYWNWEDELYRLQLEGDEDK